MQQATEIKYTRTKLKVTISLTLSHADSISSQDAISQFTTENNFRFEDTDNIKLLASTKNVSFTI